MMTPKDVMDATRPMFTPASTKLVQDATAAMAKMSEADRGHVVSSLVAWTFGPAVSNGFTTLLAFEAGAIGSCDSGEHN